MAAQSGFRALSIFKFNNRGILDGLFINSEKPCGNLGNDMVLVWKKRIRIAAFSCTGKRPQAFMGTRASNQNRKSC